MTKDNEAAISLLQFMEKQSTGVLKVRLNEVLELLKAEPATVAREPELCHVNLDGTMIHRGSCSLCLNIDEQGAGGTFTRGGADKRPDASEDYNQLGICKTHKTPHYINPLECSGWQTLIKVLTRKLEQAGDEIHMLSVQLEEAQNSLRWQKEDHEKQLSERPSVEPAAQTQPCSCTSIWYHEKDCQFYVKGNR